MKIGSVDLSKDVLIVAEIGSNHEGDFELAKELVCQAAQAGAHAVKFQTYRAEELVRKDIPTYGHVAKVHKFQYERLKTLEFSVKQYCVIQELCKKMGCMFLSTPFDKASADMLDKLVPAFKISSGDLNYLPLLQHLASKGKPILLSTGMATNSEVEAALSALGRENVVLLHCVSKYPTSNSEANLLTIPFLRSNFETFAGYSDHTIGNTACITAAALGAVVIEKHFTYDKTITHGDHILSADQSDLKQMIVEIDRVRSLLGTYGKNNKVDYASRATMRRGAVTTVHMTAGDELTIDKVKFVRPADGVSPDRIKNILGKKVRINVAEGTVLREDVLV